MLHGASFVDTAVPGNTQPLISTARKIQVFQALVTTHRGKSNLTLCVFEVPSLAPPTSSPEQLQPLIWGISKWEREWFEFCFGASPGRERCFEIEPERCRIRVWRKCSAGAQFRSRVRKASNYGSEEVLSGSAISNTNGEGFESQF